MSSSATLNRRRLLTFRTADTEAMDIFFIVRVDPFERRTARIVRTVTNVVRETILDEKSVHSGMQVTWRDGRSLFVCRDFSIDDKTEALCLVE